MNANRQQLKELFHAAVELAPHDREAFLKANCAADDELHCEVSALLSAHEAAGDFIQQPALVDVGFVANVETNRSEAVTGQQIGSYQIIRELGRGGMGSVYLAARADESFDKQVALKLIKRGMDSDAIIKRFVMERQILANLNHPNIARLIDGGTTKDGLPYFVMEYIEGQTITRYCDEHKANTMERLRLFREVCEAVQFAHQNLIVHRDLKPSNIIVTADGTPKLLDFGIAKLLSADWSSSVEATATIGRVLTPEYASPEELRGLPVTTSSDVYSLGVILYELLSGHRPFNFESRSPEDAARLITASEPIKPSVVITRIEGARHTDDTEHISLTPEAISGTRDGSVEKLRRRLAGDLDNIVLKALRKEPQRRYASVQEFSEDIRRHLEGLPVTASPDTFGYRARKFTQRHKAGVLAAAVVIITLFSATAITTWQARVAHRERVKAEQRFNDVRKLANSVVFELHDSIQNLPGSTPARELLVSRALEYLDRLANEAGQDRSLQLELAAAYDKIGDIQGGFATSNLGKRQKADESYRKALAIREALVVAEPANVDFRRKLSTSYTKMGQILWVEVDVAGSLEFHRKALEINKNLAAELPNDTEIRFDLASSYANFGYMAAASAHTDEGLENTRKAVLLMEELALADPNNKKIQQGLEDSYYRVARILDLATRNYPEALVLYRKSQEISDTLLRAEPLNTKLHRDQAVSFFNIARVSAKLGDTKTALDSSRQSLSIFTEMLSADPQNEDFRQMVAAVQAFVCQMMIKTGSAAEAIKLLNQSLQTLEKLFAASPTDETVHFRIAVVQQELGNGHAALASADKTSAQRLAHWREARSWFQKSQEIYQVFRAAGKTTGEDGARLDVVTGEIAKCDAAIIRLIGAQR
jgi:serine/threonine protein kinase/tetratricopeptide (TPR) repeat protein